MLYLLAIINLILTFFSGLAFMTIYRSSRDLSWHDLGVAVMFVSIILLFVTNIAILWVNSQRGSEISELKRNSNMLEQELAKQKELNKKDEKDSES